MISMKYILYNLTVVPLMRVGFPLASLFNKKVRKGLSGRKLLIPSLKLELGKLEGRKPRFWIHSSSMGEFEQAKPLMAALKKRFPDSLVLISLFSPSAFEHVKEYSGADIICYIPFDSKRMADQFLSLVKPDIVIVIRHDCWPNHMQACRDRGIPLVLVNFSVSIHSWAQSFLGRFANSFLYNYFDVILTVSSDVLSRVDQYRLTHPKVEVAGDTRYDQVILRASEAENVIGPLRNLKRGRKCLILGSTWPSDEEVAFEAISRLIKQGIKPWIIVVPHEPVEDHLRSIGEKLEAMGISCSRLSENDSKETDVLIIDRVGILASLYALSDIAYVGGGFGPGVHNLLEPAALGKIVMFGPRHRNSFEAGEFKSRGVGFSVENSSQMLKYLKNFFGESKNMKELGTRAARLVEEKSGATNRILERLEKILLSK